MTKGEIKLKEIGGYIELDTYVNSMLHEDALALNCGRNALAYIIKARMIKRICLPFFLCESVEQICQKEGVDIRFYSIDSSFYPQIEEVGQDEWVYIVNYYGQLNEQNIKALKEKYKRIIVDNAQSYWAIPVENVDTIYICRKYFGVPDGAFLYTDSRWNEALAVDESYERMHYLLGRYERTANEFYEEYKKNGEIFVNQPILQMSKLTKNLLHAIDYDRARKIRNENYFFLHNQLKDRNRMVLKSVDGPFAYPLWIENGAKIRVELQKRKIYIPLLWPEVLKKCSVDSLEYQLANNILPIPVDQRYQEADMQYIVNMLDDIMYES